MISYLIDALLLRRPAKYPDDNDRDESALAQWANVGRAMLGSHPDDRDDGDE